MQILRSPRTVAFFLAVASGLLIARIVAFTSYYAVNILYWDMWRSYNPLFRGWNAWQMFTSWAEVRHGGLGMIAAAILARWTGWNARADAFAVVCFISLAMILALVLKFRLQPPLSYFDLTIPLLFLTMFQFETWVIMPVPWQGALPVLLIMLYCLGLCLRDARLRFGVLLGLNFLLVFTGEGMFMGFVTVLLFVVEVLRAHRRQEPVALPLIALGIALVSDLSYFVGFRFLPVFRGYAVAASSVLQYPLFIGLLLVAFWGGHISIFGQFIPMIAGLALLLGSLAILYVRARQLLSNGISNDPLSAVIVSLISFTLLFCLFTAVGRFPLGLQQAQVSRYITLLIPGYLGWYLHVQSLPWPNLRRFALYGLLAASVVGSLPIGVIEAKAADIAATKDTWRRCYFQHEDVALCNQLTGKKLYRGIEDLPAKLQYFKDHGLNLYLDADP